MLTEHNNYNSERYIGDSMHRRKYDEKKAVLL